MPHLSVTFYFPCSSPFPPFLHSYLYYCLLPFIFISTLRTQKNACGKRCVMDQAIRFQPVNMEAWIWSQTSPYGIYGGKSGTETDFFLSTLVFPCIIAALPHILISFLYHWCCVINHWKCHYIECLCLSVPWIKTFHISLNLLCFYFLFFPGYWVCILFT